jgi:hypothetical protein
MKDKVFTTLFILSILSLQPASAAPKLPPGTIQQGSLSNQKLIHDAKVGVAAQVGILGCTQLKNFEPYVVALPTGKQGSRVWYEKWIVNGCDKQYPINLRFAEDGAGGAYWTIEK